MLMGIFEGSKPAASGDATITTVFLARTSGLDATHINAIKALINGLVADGVCTDTTWGNLDALYLFAAQDATTAKLNWVQATYGATVVNSPTFTVDQGYLTDGSTNYVDTNFDPFLAVSPNYVQNSAYAGMWSNTSAQTTNASFGALTLGGNGMAINPRNAADVSRFRITDATPFSGAANVDGKGWYANNRSGATAIQADKNGSQTATDATASVAPAANQSIRFGEIDAGISYSARIFLGGIIGGSQSAGNRVSIYSRIHTYLQTISGVA
jgi:hypothetical protein